MIQMIFSGNVTAVAIMLIPICWYDIDANPKSKSALSSGATPYHMALAVTKLMKRQKQQVTRCTRVNLYNRCNSRNLIDGRWKCKAYLLRAGLSTIENHRCFSEKPRLVCAEKTFEKRFRSSSVASDISMSNNPVSESTDSHLDAQSKRPESVCIQYR